MRRPTASAPDSTAASPRLEISILGGYGSQVASSVADGIEQQVAVGADPAAEHDQPDVGDRGDGGDMQGDAAGNLVDDLQRERVAGASSAEDRARLVRRCQGDDVPRARGERRRER